MKITALLAGLSMCFWAGAQDAALEIYPVVAGEKIVLEHPFLSPNGDTLNLSTLKFYLGNFEFWENGEVVHADNAYRLLDLEDKTSLLLPFHFPGKTTFDSLRFYLGVDSLTTASGAMGGDLDPTRGMFWTWQSGYINVKIEGTSSKSPLRDGAFAFHLGGYASPFGAYRRVSVGAVSNLADVRLDLDFTPLFGQIDWSKKPSVMSPGTEAVRLLNVLTTCFSIHEK